jgi:23S rRNA G2445 N2-methylase RlmL
VATDLGSGCASIPCDAFEGRLERAQANPEAAGVSDRVRLEPLDVARGLPHGYDRPTTFHLLHDARWIRAG